MQLHVTTFIFAIKIKKILRCKILRFTIPSNQMTAFAGRSGAGKSTMIDMLMGLNKPEKGNILD